MLSLFIMLHYTGTGLSCRKPLIGTGRAISLHLSTNGLRKRSSGHVEPSSLAVKLFSYTVGVTIGQELWPLKTH